MRRDGRAPDPLIDGGVAPGLRPRPGLYTAERIERRLSGDVAGTLKARAQAREIAWRRQEISHDAWRIARIGGAQKDLAAAVGMQERRPDGKAVRIGRPDQRKPQARIGRCAAEPVLDG